ncbi:MAG: Crp/Fnr family transcriptional regulator [Kiloniellales bacterium]|nr:Crp/Fnr family transcriptional regulator [Kiloniellales bacterium]
MSFEEARLLAASYLFRDVDAVTVDRIATLAVTRRFDTGDSIFYKGDPGEALYGVMSGRVRISTSAPDGRDMILYVMQPGEIFGEIAMLDDHERTADAYALEPTRLMLIRRRDFKPLLRSDPALADYFIRLLCRRFRRVNQVIEDAAFLPLSARLAKRLLFLTRNGAESGLGSAAKKLRVSQTELARMLGTSRETVNRALQVWHRHGQVALGRGTIEVIDREALAREGDGEPA